MFWYYLFLLFVTYTAAQISTWPTQSFITESFHPVQPIVNKTGLTAAGYLFLAAEGENATMTPLILTDSGDLVWQLDLSLSPPASDAGEQLFMNMDVQQLDNKSYLTYFNGTSSGNHAYGAVHILDHAYNQAYRVCLNPGNVVLTTPNLAVECYSDMHESQFTDRGTILLSLYNVTRADLTSLGGQKDGWVLESQFYEVDIKTGDVKFTWKSLEHQERLPINMSHYTFIANETGASEAGAFDYFHINSVTLLPDGGYLVSSRHLWAVLKLDKNGEVEWVLPGDREGSDFSQLDPKIHFSWQHHARVSNWTNTTTLLHIHNNANSEVPAPLEPTSGLLMELDLANPNNRTATLLHNFTDPNNIVYSFAEGSYQPLPNSNVLLGHGYVPEIKEYSHKGEIVMTVTFGMDNTSANSYRAFRLPWSAQPTYAPKAKAANSTTGSKSLYMSWNGATEYDQWMIYTGDSEKSLKFFANASRSGFETSIPLTKLTQGYAQAKAVANGVVLGETVVVQF